MFAEIKAIVFKTSQLKATESFFRKTLKLSIKESSAQHFVVSSKGIRLLFMEAQDNFEVEIYLDEKTTKTEEQIQADTENPTFKTSKDPNGIKVIVINEKNYHLK